MSENKAADTDASVAVEEPARKKTKTEVDDTEEEPPFPKEIDLNQSVEEIIAILPGGIKNEEELVNSMVAAG
jgi:hypothetical protein